MNWSGPATATITSWSATVARTTQGRIRPYSHRTIHSWRIRTVPETPVTRRTMSARWSPVGITSSSVTRPSLVVKVVSSSELPPR